MKKYELTIKDLNDGSILTVSNFVGKLLVKPRKYDYFHYSNDSSDYDGSNIGPKLFDINLQGVSVDQMTFSWP